jgi:hypothetical protein
MLRGFRFCLDQTVAPRGVKHAKKELVRGDRLYVLLATPGNRTLKFQRANSCVQNSGDFRKGTISGNIICALINETYRKPCQRENAACHIHWVEIQARKDQLASEARNLR